MAKPRIQVNSATGSDTTSSGAGPGDGITSGSAVSGSTGRTRNASSMLHFGLFGFTGDLASVLTDGSHTIYMAIATVSIRNHSSIAGVKNTRHTVTGNITSGASTLSALSSTSGWTSGDNIKVTGAGAAGGDLYSTINVVSSSVQVTLNDNAGTTVTGAAVENPKQVTLTAGEGINTGTTDTAWAIGGTRATVGGTNSGKLINNNGGAGDMLPGWVEEMQSGHSETVAATLTTQRDGDTTNGPIILCGTAGAVTLPILTFSNNGNAIRPTALGWYFQDFEMRNSNATKTASVGFNVAANQEVLIRRIKIAHSTNKFWKAAVPADGNIIESCEFGYCALYGIDVTLNVFIQNNYIHHCTSHGIFLSGSSSSVTEMHDNIIAYNTGDGINVGISNSTTGNFGVSIIGNTIHGNGSDGIEFTGNWDSQIDASRILSNIITFNGAYGLNFSHASISEPLVQFYRCRIENNVFNQNVTAKYNGVTVAVSINESTLDPSGGLASATKDYLGVTDGSTFTVGSSIKALGYPGTRKIGSYSNTQSYADPGAAQRQEVVAQVSYVGSG